MGQEGRFPPPRLSARCRISQETFAGTRANGRVAPSAVIPALAPERESSTQMRPPMRIAIRPKLTLLGVSQTCSDFI
jgi:hypothetical protein